MAMADSCDFTVGELFRSWEDVEKKLQQYKKSNLVEFWKRDSRTIDSARRRIDKPLKPELKYYEVKLCCIHGRKTFSPHGQGKRSTLTFKQDCPAFISLKANSDGTALQVKGVCFDHNHEISKELFIHLPHQRALSSDAKAKAERLLELQANKKLVQHQLSQETGNVVLLKDLTNISSSLKQKVTRNDLDCTIAMLKTKYVILSWFVDKTVAERAIKSDQLVEEEEVECRPEKISHAVVDENVDICLMRHLFTNDAWMMAESVLQQKSQIMTWICHLCSHDLHTEQCILCDHCLLWYYFSCVGLSRQPKSRNWFCRSCMAHS